jgi:hypothetical protein
MHNFRSFEAVVCRGRVDEEVRWGLYVRYLVLCLTQQACVDYALGRKRLYVGMRLFPKGFNSPLPLDVPRLDL